MSKYTAGPWTRMPGDYGLMVCNSDTRIAVAIITRQVTTASREANAQLISAAPDLLEALESMMFAAEKDPQCQRGVLNVCKCILCSYDRARAAIKKARGE